jgi:tRNA threonylcarbamoyl adenosine modification protein (Sua5/YciO/YrdC/YwlC family)
VQPLIIDTSDLEAREAGLVAGAKALAQGESIIIPTDTVYGIACDAFSPEAVNGLLGLKGRGRHMPPPVLVGSFEDVERLVSVIPPGARDVMTKFWPGGVTIVFSVHEDVVWDLGDTDGTVAIRMPDNDVALALLQRVGPLAVSSANLTGQLPAVNVSEAVEQFGDLVGVYLDGGVVGQIYRDAPGNPGSTIVDASQVAAGGPWRVLRHGVVPWEEIRQVAGGEWAG